MRGHCGMDQVARVRRATLHTAPLDRKAPFPDFGRELAKADPQLLLQPAPMAPSDAPVAAPATGFPRPEPAPHTRHRQALHSGSAPGRVR